MTVSRWRAALPLVFWAAGAFTLVMAALPQPPALAGELNDTVQHVAAFAALTLLAFVAFPRTRSVAILTRMLAFGAFIEVLQMIPALHRDAELKDWLADCAAVSGALVVGTLVRRLAQAGGK